MIFYRQAAMKIVLVMLVSSILIVNGRSHFVIPESEEEFLVNEALNQKLRTRSGIPQRLENLYSEDYEIENAYKKSLDGKPEKSLTFAENLLLSRSFPEENLSNSLRDDDSFLGKREEMENESNSEWKTKIRRGGPPVGFHFVRGKKSINA